MKIRNMFYAGPGLAAVVVTGALAGGSATANHDNGSVERYRAGLEAVPHDEAADGGSNAGGFARLKAEGNDVSVLLRASGVSPELPHAVHIHGHEANDEIAKCPGASHRDDLVDDGLIETVEGLEDYGPVQVSFTTEGDTSADSVLALDRVPVGAANGSFTYRRTIEVPKDVSNRLDEKHIVVHGQDINGDGAYGGRTTALGAPLEGELPVACGEIDTVDRRR